jgi:hypothetical protein
MSKSLKLPIIIQVQSLVAEPVVSTRLIWLLTPVLYPFMVLSISQIDESVDAKRCVTFSLPRSALCSAYASGPTSALSVATSDSKLTRNGRAVAFVRARPFALRATVLIPDVARMPVGSPESHTVDLQRNRIHNIRTNYIIYGWVTRNQQLLTVSLIIRDTFWRKCQLPGQRRLKVTGDDYQFSGGLG